ncbi:MAG: hypothetical protein HY537_09420 [Deltaproteobacteria bacterium]|nr:hypothetical protein [Deltaproteobacteria bacterium]
MSFKRKILPDVFPEKDELTRQLVSIGFLFASDKNQDEPNIENVLVAASIEGLKGDLRTLSLLVDWVPIHLKQTNIDRLTSILVELGDKKLKAFWSALAKWQEKDPRMTKLQRIYRGPRVALLEEDEMSFFLKRDGEDNRFRGSKFLVPAKVLRHRESDIASPGWVAKNHKAYKYRIIIGPTYRADMWALLEREPNLGPSEVARRCYGSFGTAWDVKKDWMLIQSLAA